MRTVLLINGFRFFFYSNEHLPIHIHVKKAEAAAKLVLEPEILLEKNYGFKPAEVSKIVEIVVEHYEYLIEKWHETFD
ncbi:MAG: DUF4160 domain-containing protein [Cyclobacteriaceae bacterium]|nr:DUF4160 domain-containing protein [Cyclobacteriaceae bacterium HetDA_MAG_MS6]